MGLHVCADQNVVQMCPELTKLLAMCIYSEVWNDVAMKLIFSCINEERKLEFSHTQTHRVTIACAMQIVHCVCACTKLPKC